MQIQYKCAHWIHWCRPLSSCNPNLKQKPPPLPMTEEDIMTTQMYTSGSKSHEKATDCPRSPHTSHWRDQGSRNKGWNTVQGSSPAFLMDSGLLRCINRKSSLHKKNIHSPAKSNEDAFKHYRNTLTRLIRSAKAQYFKRRLQEHKSDSKKKM